MTITGPRDPRLDWQIVAGDSAEKLLELENESVDAVVTDPPAGIAFMGKAWDKDRGGRDEWIAWLASILRECLRVLKPGGHAVVWALPRTSHWTATALEDAGFEVRDVLTHHFGNGFPKSLDVSKAIDKNAGIKREVLGYSENARPNRIGKKTQLAGPQTIGGEITEPVTKEAVEWQGWGTALKPATEHWILARKPSRWTVAANVLKHGTGALNVDGCRVGITKRVPGSARSETDRIFGKYGAQNGTESRHNPNIGRWPTNLLLTHLEECRPIGTSTLRGDRREGKQGSRDGGFVNTGADSGDGKPCGKLYGDENVESWHCAHGCPVAEFKDAARFFPTFRYEAKPSRTERETGCRDVQAQTKDSDVHNSHPTVKSIALMRWLCRLVTPPRGLVLDPFCGSGSTGLACIEEGFSFLGIEQDAHYCEIARARLEAASKQLKLF